MTARSDVTPHAGRSQHDGEASSLPSAAEVRWEHLSPIEIGRAVRVALRGCRPPLLAVETTFSFLRGTVSPEDWGAALAGLMGAHQVSPDHRGANHPADRSVYSIALQAGAFTRATQVPPPAPTYVSAPDHPAVPGPWAGLADVGDLAGLPAAIDRWGRRVAVGATVPLRRDRRAEVDLVWCLAPAERGYRSLCRFLSWRHEDDTAWAAWQSGLTHDAPPLEGVVVLARDLVWAERFAWHGAEVYGWLWRSSDPCPPGFSPVLAPLVSTLTPGATRQQRLRALIQERSHVRHHIEATGAPRPSLHLSDLPALFAEMADMPQALQAGHQLLDRCSFTPGAPLPDGHTPWQLPPALVPDPDAELRMRCREGMLQRYGGREPSGARERLAYELDVITRKGFAPYILAVWLLARSRRTCGRGSAASSLVCYALGITNVDPLKYGLVFERFLSEERFDPPDIDVDFPHDERDAVLQETIDRFGPEHVALVSTHQTLQEQGAVREAGRVMNRDRAAITAAQRELSLARRFQLGDGPGDAWQAVMAAAEDLVGTPTHFGVHCGGIVITRDPIREVVPVHRAAKQLQGRPAPAIAWEKDGAEQLGLVKIDFLGNRSLGVVRDTLSDLREDGITIDEWRWAPDEDLRARELVAAGRTIGCFYIESPAMRLLNSKAGATDFDRLTLHSSIIRPAANSWINTYLERLAEYRKTGRHRDEWYPHPALRSLLSDSFGVLSYQEDLMLVSRDLAGFSIKQQNQLRKALGRSDTPQRLAGLKSSFLDGCRARQVPEDVITFVWNNIVSFSGYSFTKAHSASYVMVSFQAAFLKAHYPAHFLARVISNEGGFYGPCAYVEEARRFGIEILPPCVVAGTWDTRRAGSRSIRLGFHLLRGIHRATIERILRERRRAPFLGAADLWRRCSPSEQEMRLLLWAGAFDGLLRARSQAERFWLIEQALALPHAPAALDSDQLELDFARETKGDPEPPPALPAIPQRALDRHAWNALGIVPRAHPFALWDLPTKRAWWCRDVCPRHRGRRLTILGWVITAKEVLATQLRQRDGTSLPAPSITPMSFVTIEDEGGIAETVWFPECYRLYGAAIESGRPCWVTGRVVVEFGVATLHVESAKS